MNFSTLLRRGRTTAAGRPRILDEREIAFVICVEANQLEPQARLLCESIRTFGGRYRNAPIVAVSPRPHLAPGPQGRAHLEALGVTCITSPLNDTGSPYGTINRIVAGAWAETALSQSHLVVLDTDMLVVSEPEFWDDGAGVRPVAVKGSASSGRGDRQDAYWTRMSKFGGIDVSRLPMLRTTIDDVRIRASYNGGFTVVRRELGILRKTHDVFFASLAENLRPHAGTGLEIHASTGSVGVEASEWWGSSQAALSIGIWSTTRDVRIYDERYNIPLTPLIDPNWSWPLRESPVLLHCHYLTEPEYHERFLEILQRLKCTEDSRRWIAQRLPLFQTA